MTKAQKNYDITNIEAYALVCAVREFRMWLINSAFKVYTDHYSLVWLNRKKGSSGRLLRWSIELSEYNYTTIHKSGISNSAADFLSRISYDEASTGTKDEDDEKIVFSLSTDVGTSECINRQLRQKAVKSGRRYTELTFEWERNAEVKSLAAESNSSHRAAEKSMERQWDLNSVNTGDQENRSEIAFQQYDLKKLQRECDDFREIIDYKENGRLPENKEKARQVMQRVDNFYMNSAGILYHVQCIRNKRLHEYLPLVSQVCVPRCLREIVLRQVHDKACHAGFEKAWSTARQRFWWKSLAEDLNVHIKACIKCVRCKPAYNKKKVPQTNIEQASFLEAWSFDHVGPLTETDGPIKYRYILSATEHLSLYTELWPMETCSASETAEKMYELICRWSVFKKIQVDRGSAFVAKLTRELMRLVGVQINFSSSHHAQTNGRLERFHSTLGVALRAYAEGSKTTWHKLLPTITHGFNTTAVTPSGFIPFTVVTGVTPRTLADCLIQPDNDLPTDIESYVAEIQKRVAIIRDIAKKNIEEEHERTRLKHDSKGTSVPSFTAGDIVFLRREQFKKNECAKLSDRYEGPMLILHCGPHYTYKLRDMRTNKTLKSMINACRLRPYDDKRDLIYNRNGAQYDPSWTETSDATAAVKNNDLPLPAATALNQPTAASKQAVANTKLTRQQQQQLGVGPADRGDQWFTIKKVLRDKRSGISRKYLVVWSENNSRSWVEEKDMAPKSLRDYWIVKEKRAMKRRCRRRQC